MTSTHAPADAAGAPPPVQAVMSRRTPTQAPDRLLRGHHDDTPRVLTFPAGETGLLVTAYDQVRQVLADAGTFDSVDAPFGHLINDAPPGAPVPPGALLGTNGPAHARLRSRVAGEFTVRRMRAYSTRVRAIVHSVLDDLADRPDRTTELNLSFSQRISAHAIGELLGLPTAEREGLGHWATRINDIGLSSAARRAADENVHDYVRERLRDELADPGDNVLGRLVRDRGADRLTFDELTTLGATLIVAGQETTANAISLAALTVIQSPELGDRLRAEPDAAGEVCEELLRFQSIVHLGVARRCSAATTVGGHPVGEGDLVVPSIVDANHDPALTRRPEVFDPARGRTRHVAFGYGAHQCLGQHLARVEMTEALAALARRVPSMTLAVHADHVRGLMNMTVYGVESLPVTWREILPAREVTG